MGFTDTETVGFSAAHVDEGQMGKGGVGYIDARNRGDVNMRWIDTTNRRMWVRIVRIGYYTMNSQRSLVYAKGTVDTYEKHIVECYG